MLSISALDMSGAPPFTCHQNACLETLPWVLWTRYTAKTGRKPFPPQILMMLLWSSSQNSHHHELEHDHLGFYYSSDQSCWNDRISAILWVFVRVFSPASLLSKCQTEYKGSVPTYLHSVLPHSIRHRGQVYCSTVEMNSWLCKRVEPLHEAFGEYELEYLACLFITAII